MTSPQLAAASAEPELTAYVINPRISMRLLRADGRRSWMDATDARFANRCLPLLMANQAGWFLVSDHAFRVEWDGGRSLDSLNIELLAGPKPCPASSHFGHGILTFSLPFLFRTSASYNLLVRGPPNHPKDGISPLEGLVETDWSPATFTVNWQLTRPGVPVSFEIGEPIGMIVPQRRGELESFRTSLRELRTDAALASRHHEWSRSREVFLDQLRVPNSCAAKQKWQKDYFLGVDGEAGARTEHQTKLHLRDFATPGARTPIVTYVSSTEIPRAASTRAPKSEPASTPAARRNVSDAEAIVRELHVVDGFADAETCRTLVALHRRFGKLETGRDNGFCVTDALRRNPEAFDVARGLVNRMRALIESCYRKQVGCDLALVCGVTPAFCHVLHADNARVVCARHGEDAVQLRRAGCHCEDVRVLPNHTPWREYTGLLYLSSEHEGGAIVFGEGPNVYGRTYRKEITPRAGLLVLSPSNELYFHHTTPVTKGVRYSMNSWFTSDRAHIDARWGG